MIGQSVLQMDSWHEYEEAKALKIEAARQVPDLGRMHVCVHGRAYINEHPLSVECFQK